MQIRRFRGSRTVMSFRLCSRAPWTTSSSAAIYHGHSTERTPVRLGSAREKLHETAELARAVDARDLEVAGDDRPVAEKASQERLVVLDGADAREMDCRGLPAHDAVHDEELFRRQHDVRSV